MTFYSEKSTALVLGAGGLAGMAYHVGVLRALETFGFRPNECDLIIGTSAGAVIGGYLRKNYSVNDLYQMAVADSGRNMPKVLNRAGNNPVESLPRLMGSLFVASQSLLKLNAERYANSLLGKLPAGAFWLGDGKVKLEHDLGESWPKDKFWTVSQDLANGKRFVFGRDNEKAVNICDGVNASVAIPGIYPPFLFNGRFYVDGGAYSTSNLDLAVLGGYSSIVAVIPMAFDPLRPPNPTQRLLRAFAVKPLSRELHLAKQKSIRVSLFRPSNRICDLQGINLMRSDNLAAVESAAFDETMELVNSGRVNNVFAA